MISKMIRKNSIMKLKVVIKKLQKSLLVLAKRKLEDEETNLPEDVKQGHFAVVATGGEEVKRFVVPLSYLSHPSFLKLLEQAAEEYGFICVGALVVPCRPAKLERILAEQWDSEEKVHASSKTLVNIC